MTARRRYREIADRLRAEIVARGYRPGDRILTERQIAEVFDVPRSVVREAVMMLEIEGFVEVRKGSGIYLLVEPGARSGDLRDDIGPFELLQARQVLESAIAEQAARTITKPYIVKMREALMLEAREIETGEGDFSGDRLFHQLIAEATQNSALADVVDELWRKRARSPMWAQLHERIFDVSYRRRWLGDHQAILTALQQKDPAAARQAMWQHLENVRTTLFDLSNAEDPDFDGYLFTSVSASQG
ncbi:FCD domain-containing protein [Oricola cellulosilytica]|uniref:FCD domain-containing protein n=1 Tax=Oricola cellulosilytica TaxID=1429082 RepID=A0A4R0P8G8_9HYPH|nr:FCD domain-containing protein [Oricola cellulosilytica]TCD13363.1 FCD domain-containing protein [Oricola cellulosilytica]